MNIKFCFLFVSYFLCFCVYCDKSGDENAEKFMSDQIFAIIEHYKQNDPIGLPQTIVQIPDPFKFPDFYTQIKIASIQMTNIKIYGLSKFRIIYIKTDLKNLQVEFKLSVNEIKTIGNYSLQSFTKSQGPFNVVVRNVVCEGNLSLGIMDNNGKMKAKDIKMDVNFDGMSMDFKNLGMLGAVFQGFINSAPNALFDAMKPFILSESYTQLRKEIDNYLDKSLHDYCFANSISPMDVAIIEARKQIRLMGFDPYKMKDYYYSFGILGLGANMNNMVITGISSFYRVGNVTMEIKNHTAVMSMNFGTQKLMGKTDWKILTFGGLKIRSGNAEFSIQHIKMKLKICQNLDTRKRSEIQDLQFDLGNIQVHCDGAGTLDYILEILINIFPNIIRYQIMDAIETPVKKRIQERLNKINVEEVIKEKVPDFIKYGASGVDLDFDF